MIPNPSQEPPASSKAPNKDLKDMDVLCTLEINKESQNFDHGCFKVSDCILIKIEIPNASQKAPQSSKSPNHDVIDKEVLCTFQIKIKSNNFDNECIKDQCLYQNQYHNTKLQ